MENVLLVTVGMRDLQVANVNDLNFWSPNIQLIENRNIPNFKLFSNPREAGALILFDKSLQEKVEYPIIKPAIDYVIEKKGPISKVILIDTNQQDPKFRNSDTVHFSQIIESLILEQYPREQVFETERLTITKDLTNYGEMYVLFSKRLPEILDYKNPINLFVFAQGGIDAINFQALLKSIELFPNTFHLCKSEANSEIELSDFPNKFRLGVEKQNILFLIGNFHYQEVLGIDPYIQALSSYAYHRLLSDMGSAIDALKLVEETPLICNLIKTGYQIQDDIDYQFIDFYLAAKICFKKGDFSSFVLRVTSLIDHFLEHRAKELLHSSKISFDFLTPELQKRIILLFPDVFKKTTGDDWKDMVKPKGYIYYLTICTLFEQKWVNNPYFMKSLRLRDLRNKIAHEAKNAALEQIKTAFQDSKTTEDNYSIIDLFFAQGDKFWGVTGFGDFEIINDAIRTRLLTYQTK
jgi:hypothetical protein